MSGIFCVYDKTGKLDLTAICDRVRQFYLPGSGPHHIEYSMRGNVLLGRYHLGVFSQPEIVPLPDTDSLIVTSGYICGDVPQHHGDSGFDRTTCLQLDQWLQSGRTAGFASLDGAYQLARFDGSTKDLTIAVDRHGLQPLYYYNDAEILVFAPEIALLICLLSRTPAIDRPALADWFTYGFIPGSQTLFEGICVFPPGSIGYCRDGTLTFREYWSPIFADDSASFAVDDTIDSLDHALRKAMHQRQSLTQRGVISLSGGMDSRLLLAAAAPDDSLTAYTFGPPGSSEFDIAAAVAAAAGLSHIRFVETAPHCAEHFETGVRKSGGTGNVLDFAGLAFLPDIARKGQTVINGYGGNYLLGYLAFDLLRFIVPRTVGYASSWLARKWSSGWPATRLHAIRRMLDGENDPPHIHLREQLCGYPERSMLSLVYHLILLEKGRRGDLSGLTMDNLFMEPLAPFYANDVIELALRIPPRQRLLARLYRRMFRRRYPKMAAITYNRTGLPITASAARIAAHKLLARLRPQPGPDDVRAAWLKNEWREYLGDYLQTGRPKIYDLLGREMVESTLMDFLSGRIAARPVGQLLGCEIALRIF